MKISQRRPIARDYTTLFLSGILLGVVTVVFGIMLAFTQSRNAHRVRDIGEQSRRQQHSTDMTLNSGNYILKSTERMRTG